MPGWSLYDTLPGGQYAAGWGFILVYRLAIDAKTRKGDGGAD